MKYLYLLSISLFLSFGAWAGPITGTTTVCQFSTTSLTDATAGGTWYSSATTIATIGSVSGIVSGILPGTATITYTSGLTYVTTTVTVTPTPVITSTLTPPAICDSGIFNYTPLSTAAGTLFTWSRAYVPGSPLLAGAGTDNPNEQLVNSTYFPVVITYVYTLTAGGCANTANVTVTVNPTPMLSSALTQSVCDSTLFNYVASSFTPGAAFSWARSAVAGISNPASSGVGSINETLHNTTPSPVTVTYYFTLTANGCSHNENITLTVNPCSLLVPQTGPSADNIYPNPNNGVFTMLIHSPANEQVTLIITNMTGEKVKEITTETNISSNVTLDVPEGIYFLSATTSQNKYYSRITIVK